MTSKFRRSAFLFLLLTVSLLILASRTAIFSALISLSESRSDLALYSIAPLSMQIGGLLSLLVAGSLIRRFPPRRLAQTILLCGFACTSGLFFFHDAGRGTILLLFSLALCTAPFEPLSHYLIGLIEKQRHFRSRHSLLVLAGVMVESAASAIASLLYPISGVRLNFVLAGGFALLSLLAFRCMPIPAPRQRSRRPTAVDDLPCGTVSNHGETRDRKHSFFAPHRSALRECLSHPRIVFLGMTFILYVALLSSLQSMIIPLIVSVSGPRSLALVQLMFASGFVAGCLFSSWFAVHEKQFMVALLANCLLILSGLLQPTLPVFLLVAMVTGFFPPIVISTAASEVQKTTSQELQPYAMSLLSLTGGLAAVGGAAVVLVISFCLRYFALPTALAKPLLTVGIAAALYLLLSVMAAAWFLKRGSWAREPAY